MTGAGDEAVELRRAYVAALVGAGVLTDPVVTAAFGYEPRHLYVPAFYRNMAERPGWERIDAGHPDWLPSIYSNRHLVTLLSDADTGIPLSSSTAPSLMAAMLEALDVEPGMSVAEVGTGTGYNAGLLARVAGDENVTTIDIEPAATMAASAALAATGHPTVRVACRDASKAGGVDSPVDRIIATCAVTDIPQGWRNALRPGGRIVAPYATGVIVLDAIGAVLQGRFLKTPAYFMELRHDGPPTVPSRRAEPTTPTSCEMPIDAWWTEEGFRLAVALGLPGLTGGSLPTDDDLLLWHGDGSIVRIGPHCEARSDGPRDLAELLGHMWQTYQRHGTPSHDRFGLTVDAHGTHTVWLDDPKHAVEPS